MKRRFRFLVLLVVIVGGLTLAATHKEAFETPPWNTLRSISYPNSAVTDKAGAFLVSDRGGRRLSKIDAKGQLVWERFGGSRSGGFYTASILAADSSGGVWILNSILSPATSNAERLELVLVSANGGFGAPRWSRTLTEDEQKNYNQTPYFFRVEGTLATYCRTNSAGDTEIHVTDLVTGKDNLTTTLIGVDGYDYVSAVTDRSGQRGWFLDTGGRIQAWTAGVEGLSSVFENQPTKGTPLLVPSQLNRLIDGTFLLFDGKTELMHVTEGQAERRFSAAERGGEVYFTGMVNDASDRVVLTSEAQHEVLLVEARTGTLVSSVSGGQLAGAGLAWFWAAWSGLVAGIAGILSLLGLFYVQVLRQRTPLLFKQLAIFVPLITLSVLAISVWIYQDMLGRYSREVETRQLVWSQLAAGMIDSADLDSLGFGVESQETIMAKEAFVRLQDQLTKIVGANLDPWNSASFDYLYVPAGGNWYVFDQFGYFERYLAKPVMLQVAESKKPLVGRYQDAYSQWLSGFTPVLRADGSVAALMEVTMDQNVFSEVNDSFQRGLAWGLFAVLAGLFGATFLTTFLMLRSIQALQQSALRISSGDYESEVTINSKDEIEDLGHVFNQMSRQIQASVERIVSLNRANAKFVPSQFLTYLGRENITEVRLGDQVEREMTVLFSDIRGFTTLSESMTTAENFDFINQFLMVMGPKIRTRNGFIDKYIGDAIMALFPNEAEDGLLAAFAMFEALADFNKSTTLKLPPGGVQIGVGLHTGRLMLGIVGEAERFDGTVISDSVNLASRLESLTKYYGASLLTSGQTLARIRDRSGFHSRLLDRVQVKGKTEVVEIHEVLVPGSPGFEAKRNHQNQFATALEAYFAGEFSRAQALFSELARVAPGDQALPVFLARLSRHRDPLVAWTGVVTLDSK